VLSVAVSPDGTSGLSGGKDSLIRLWNVATGKAIRNFSGHHDWIWAVGFSGDGQVALSAGTDKSIRLWDVESGREIRALGEHTDVVLSAVFAPDGRVLSAAMESEAMLWDFPRPSRQEALAPRARKAVEVLRARPGDPESLAVLGEWYAFRGVWDRAIELLERARRFGVAVSALTLAQGYMELADTDAARHELDRARQGREAPAYILDLLRQGLPGDVPVTGDGR
jgi:hypothetical protein